VKRAGITGLQVISVIAVTVATFMPMKAILLLASDSVPSFFPETLVTGGPLAAAVTLLVASAVAAVVTALINRFLATQRSDPSISGYDDASLLPSDMQLATRRGAEQTDFTAEVLIVVIFGVGVLVLAPTFLTLTCLWLVVVFIWARRSQQAEQADEYLTSADSDWPRRYRKAVQQTMLPSTIVIALLTLLVSTPRLGATGALLAIVLARRFQLAVASVAGDLQARVTHSSRISVDSASPGKHADAPTVLIDELTQRVHGEAFWHEASSCLDRGEAFTVLGSAGGRQSITLVIRGFSADSQGYLRVFRRNAQRVQFLECQFRSSRSPVSLFPGDACRAEEIAGFPVLRIHTPSRIVTGARPSRREVLDWYSRLKARCIDSSDFQEWAASRVREFPEDEFLYRLTTASLIPGCHLPELKQLVAGISALNDALRPRPLSWMPAANLNLSSFAEREDGDLSLLSPMGWSVGRVGDRSEKSAASALESESDDQDGNGLAASALESLAQRRSRLLRQLRLLDLRGAESTAADILRELANETTTTA